MEGSEGWDFYQSMERIIKSDWMSVFYEKDKNSSERGLHFALFSQTGIRTGGKGMGIVHVDSYRAVTDLGPYIRLLPSSHPIISSLSYYYEARAAAGGGM